MNSYIPKYWEKNFFKVKQAILGPTKKTRVVAKGASVMVWKEYFLLELLHLMISMDTLKLFFHIF